MWRVRSVRLCDRRSATLAGAGSAFGEVARGRRGVVVLESLVVLLILVLGLLAVIEWSIVMMTHAGVTAAAAEGARTAARAVFVTSRQVDTEQAVAAVLGAHGVTGLGMLNHRAFRPSGPHGPTGPTRPRPCRRFSGRLRGGARCCPG